MSNQPIPRQLVIRRACVAVESFFSKTMSPAQFAAIGLPAFAVALLAKFFDFPCASLVCLAATVAFVIALCRRFHDLGKSGTNLLQVLIPVFIYFWIGSKIAKIENPTVDVVFAVLVFLWPAIMLLRLTFTRGAAEKYPVPEKF